MSKITIKKSDTFLVTCNYTDSSGVGVDLTSIDIKSQIRSMSDDLLCELVVAKANQTTNTGQYTLRQPNLFVLDVGNYLWDIQYTSDGVVTSTDTIEIEVGNEVTR